LNDQKWASIKVLYADLQTWKDACRVNRYDGANPVEMAHVVRTLPFAVRLRCRMILADIDTQLKSGGLVILNIITSFMDDYLRWSLIIGKVGQKGEPSFRVVNFDRRAHNLPGLVEDDQERRAKDGRVQYALFPRKR